MQAPSPSAFMPAQPHLVHITEPSHDVAIDLIYAGAGNFTGEWWHYQRPDAQRFPLIDSHAFMACVPAVENHTFHRLPD